MPEEISEDALAANECPVCHSQLTVKNDLPWCSNCELSFTQ